MSLMGRRDGALQGKPVFRAVGLGPPSPSSSSVRAEDGGVGRIGGRSLPRGDVPRPAVEVEKYASMGAGNGLVGWLRNATVGLARGISTQCRMAASAFAGGSTGIGDKHDRSPRRHRAIALGAARGPGGSGLGERHNNKDAVRVTLEIVEDGSGPPSLLKKTSSFSPSKDIRSSPSSPSSSPSTHPSASSSSASFEHSTSSVTRTSSSPSTSTSIVGLSFAENCVALGSDASGSGPSLEVENGPGVVADMARRKSLLLAGSRRGHARGHVSGGWARVAEGEGGGEAQGGEALSTQKIRSKIRSKVSDNAIAGALAGGLVSCCLHPIDTVKTVVQSERGLVSQSLFPVMTKILSERGIMGLYRGLGSNFATAAPISAIYTSTYEAVKELLLPHLPKNYHAVAHCVAGGCASVATSFVFTPSECVKQRMQVGGQYANSWAALIGILQSEGLRSLYAGWGAVLCRNVPQSIIKFLTYEQLKHWALQRNQSDRLSHWQTLAIGGAAGSTAAFVTTPFDVIKTRLQTQVPGLAVKYNGVAHALTTILAEEGIRGLYRGVGPRLFIYVSQGAIFFASYELARRALVSGTWPMSNRIAGQVAVARGVPITTAAAAAAASEEEDDVRAPMKVRRQERQRV